MKNKTKLVNLKSYKNSMKYIFMIHDLIIMRDSIHLDYL